MICESRNGTKVLTPYGYQVPAFPVESPASAGTQPPGPQIRLAADVFARAAAEIAAHAREAERG